MEKFQNAFSSPNSVITIVVGGTIMGLGLMSHFNMISRTWFFQDDFGFLFRYGSLSLDDFLNPSTNFGRPISRDLYWWLILELFGRDAQAFLFINLITMICSGALSGIWIRFLGAPMNVAFILAIIYLVMLPSIVNLSWISNSQHIMGHFFVFLILVIGALLANDRIPTDFRILTLLTILYLFGLGCNVFMLCVLPVLLAQSILLNWIQTHDGKRFLIYWALPMALIGISWAFILTEQMTSNYTVEYSVAVLEHNLKFYYNSLGIKWLLGPCLFGLLIGLFSEGRRTVILLLITATCFYLPFAFAKYQRYENYAALSFVTLLGASLFGVGSFRSGYRVTSTLTTWFKSLLPLMLLICVFLVASPTRNFFASNPRGNAEYQFAKATASRLATQGGTICFEKAKKSTETLDEGMTPFWTFLGGGLAFRFFDPKDGRTRHYYLSSHKGCDCSDSFRVVVHHMDWKYYAEWKKMSDCLEN